MSVSWNVAYTNQYVTYDGIASLDKVTEATDRRQKEQYCVTVQSYTADFAPGAYLMMSSCWCSSLSKFLLELMQ